MTSALFSCPLCGYGFDAAANPACQSCPLHAGCRMVCCPSCGHTAIDPQQSWLVQRISAFTQRFSSAGRSSKLVDKPACEQTLADIALGQQARITNFQALGADQQAQLYGYGLLPGCVLRVVQRTPVTVVAIDQIQLAIETEVARGVLVSNA